MRRPCSWFIVAAVACMLAACEPGRASYAINYVPFGAGQVQNRQPRKALWFAASEAVTAATSVVTWEYLVDHYGAHGQVPAAEASRARTLQDLEVVSGFAFFGLAAWGIVDAVLNYEPSASINGSPVLIGPIVTPDHAGFGVSWSQ